MYITTAMCLSIQQDVSCGRNGLMCFTPIRPITRLSRTFDCKHCWIARFGCLQTRFSFPLRSGTHSIYLLCTINLLHPIDSLPNPKFESRHILFDLLLVVQPAGSDDLPISIIPAFPPQRGAAVTTKVRGGLLATVRCLRYVFRAAGQKGEI